jgi:ribokinase
MTDEPRAGQGSVLVVGSINVDLVVSTSFLPARGETVVGGRFSQHHGGKGANQAVAAARMGAAVSFVGAVGSDAYGSEALGELLTEGIDVSRVQVLAGESTGIALIVVDKQGQNQIAVASGANARVDGALVSRALAAGAAAPTSAISTAGPGAFLANLEVRDDAVVAGARYARERGMKVIVNPAPARALNSELITLSPILVPNEVEAEALTGEHDPQMAARLLSGRTGAPVIVTLGARGVIVVRPEGVQPVTPPYAEVVDTTGAGDAFCGALAAELACGSTLIDAARIAVRAATMSTEARGARTAMPRRTMLGA